MKDHGRKLRVAFINDTARNGGPGRSLHCILKFLDPEAIHRTVVLPRAGEISELLETSGVADEIVFERNLVENPIEPWSRPMQRADFDAPAAKKAWRAVGNVVRGAVGFARLASFLRRGKFDLIYCNGTNADFAGGALAAVTGIPAIWHVRYTSLPSAVRAIHKRLSSSSGVKRIVCVSHAAAAQFPHCNEKVRVINNALDVDDYSASRNRGVLREELGLSADTVIFGSQGRILPRKGYAEMTRAAKIALDAMTPEERDRVRFVVLGDTPEDYHPDHLAECIELSRTLGIASHMIFLGFRADVRPYVVDFDIAIVPSIYADPLPRAVIESMAFGKPVIAFDVGGVSEMLRDGESGALVQANPPDVEGMAKQFLRYLRDPELRKRQGETARERVVAEFDGRAHSAKIQREIIESVG